MLFLHSCFLILQQLLLSLCMHCCDVTQQCITQNHGRWGDFQAGLSTAVGLCIFRTRLQLERETFCLMLNRLSHISMEHLLDFQLSGISNCRSHLCTCTSATTFCPWLWSYLCIPLKMALKSQCNEKHEQRVNIKFWLWVMNRKGFERSKVPVSSTAALRSKVGRGGKKNVLSQLLGINYLWAAQSLQSYVMNVLT